MGSAPSFSRTAFTTSRLLDFVSERELTLQCGYGPRDWPLVVVKELIDNALDACEERGIPPVIEVAIDESSITVADNGPGIPPDVVDRMLDFSVRVSSREAYVAPDRGAQGNALKTIVAMPFVLDGNEGRVDIVGAGIASEIRFCVDRIAQRPAADVSRSYKSGSVVRVHWPVSTSSEDGEGRHVFTSRDEAALDRETADDLRQLVEDFAFLNPHATLTVDGTTFEATDPAWAKWKPSSPTSPHWYEPEHLERLLGAYITHDLANGRERTVREFVSEFKGVSSTIRQKEVLAEVDLSRAPLSALLAEDERDFDHERVARLLAAMKTHSNPVGPRPLGTIGKTHLAKRFEALGIREGSFEYKRVATLGDDGLPQVTEVAFAAREDEDAGRRLVTGVNWSAAWVNPFRRLGEVGKSLDTMMTTQKFEAHRPIALLVHVAHPRVQYSDRGKSTVIAQ
jgi:DNA topoisomerase VI subunit B